MSRELNPPVYSGVLVPRWVFFVFCRGDAGHSMEILSAVLTSGAKAGRKTINRSLLDLRASLRGNGLVTKYAGGEPPLRSELFSADQMKLHGKTLAASHSLSAGRPRDRLLARLAENEDVLIGVRGLLTDAVQANRRITPAAEWLLDNFYLIEEQIRTAKRHLPKGYSRELPALLAGASSGLPRVYDIALETISHGDGRVDPESLANFVTAYQTVTALKLGELWAIPIMLRLALIENLRRVGARVAADRINRNQADSWADQMTEVAEKDPKSLILMIADMVRSSPPMVSSFVAEFARRLQGQSAALALPLTWIEQQLAESGLTIEQLVQSENQQQAADQVSISNSIGSLRFLGAMDWREFVETMSVVEQTLREDPGGVYGKMDFATRDRYRHVVENIAKSSLLTEGEIARQAIDLARERATAKSAEDRAAHVGYYLIDKGLARLGRAAHVRPSIAETARETMGRVPLPLYLGAILLIALLFTAGLVEKAYAGGLHGWALALNGHGFAAVRGAAGGRAGELAGDAAGDASCAAPHGLLRGYSTGITHAGGGPGDADQRADVEDLVEALEVRFLANRDGEPALRPVDRFSRRARGNAAGRRTAVAVGADQDRRAQPKVRRRIFSFPSSALLESAGAGLDGLRAQAGEAGGIEFAAARRHLG